MTYVNNGFLYLEALESVHIRISYFFWPGLIFLARCAEALCQRNPDLVKQLAAELQPYQQSSEWKAKFSAVGMPYQFEWLDDVRCLMFASPVR